MRQKIIFAAAIFLLAFIVRLAYLLQMAGTSPFILHEVGDSTIYLNQAKQVLAGDWLAGDDAFFHSSPAYIYFIAGIFGMFGESLFTLRFIQILFGSLSCVLLYFIGERYFGRRAGVITGVMAALYGFLIFSDADVLAINLVICAMLGSFLFLVRGQEMGSPGRIALSGVLLGLSALGKPDILLLAPVLFFWLFFFVRHRTDLPPSRPYILCLVLFLSVTLTVIPATIRNYVVQNDRVLITSNGGVNFFIGNNPEASGMFMVPAGTKIHNDHRFYRSTFTLPEEQTGRRMLPSEVSRFWFGKGLEFVRDQPWESIKLLGLKFALFWNWYEIPNHHDYYYAKEYLSSLLRMPFIVGFSVMVPLAMTGMFLCIRRANAPLFPLFAFIIVPMLSTVVFFVTGRYRLPALTFLFPFAGLAAHWLYEEIRARTNRRRLAMAAAVLIVAGVLANVRMEGFDPTLGIANEHDDIASLYYQQGEYKKAAEMYERAAAFGHNEALLRYKAGGIYHRQLKEPEKAHAAFKRSAELAPKNIDAALNLGALALETGRTDEAEQEFKKILEMEPGHVKAAVNLGVVFIHKDRPGEAIPILERVVTHHPDHEGALTNLGYAHLLLKDWKKAAHYEEAALRINPASAIARFDLALALLGLGDKKGAAGHLEQVLGLIPTMDPLAEKARQELKRLQSSR